MACRQRWPCAAPFARRIKPKRREEQAMASARVRDRHADRGHRSPQGPRSAARAAGRPESRRLGRISRTGAGQGTYRKSKSLFRPGPTAARSRWRLRAAMAATQRLAATCHSRTQQGPARLSTAGHAAQDGVGRSLRGSLARRPRDLGRRSSLAGMPVMSKPGATRISLLAPSCTIGWPFGDQSSRRWGNGHACLRSHGPVSAWRACCSAVARRRPGLRSRISWLRRGSRIFRRLRTRCRRRVVSAGNWGLELPEFRHLHGRSRHGPATPRWGRRHTSARCWIWSAR
jgi:hypothetical protein